MKLQVLTTRSARRWSSYRAASAIRSWDRASPFFFFPWLFDPRLLRDTRAASCRSRSAPPASADAIGRSRPATARPQENRAAGRFRPDVSQFVDVERTWSKRRLEHWRNPLLRGERLNTAMRNRLREPGRKPETEPSVSAPVGTVIVMPALWLRTCPGSPFRSDTKQGGSLVNCTRGSTDNLG